MKIEIDLDDTKVRQAFERAPEVMHRHLDDALSRGARELTDAAKRGAPKAFSTLANSLNDTAVGDLHYEVRPGTHYARYVEHGVPSSSMTKFPNLMGLAMWVRRKLGVSDLAEAGRLAYVIGRKLKANGIKAQPFMGPAKEEKDARVRALMKGAVARGLDEVFGGG